MLLPLPLPLLLLLLLQCSGLVNCYIGYHHQSNRQQQQQQQLSSSSSSSSSVQDSEVIVYDRPKEDDLKYVASIISSNFDGPFSDTIMGKLKKQYSEWDSAAKLEFRYFNLLNANVVDFKKQPHCMIVARNKMTNKPVGFVEVGMVQSSAKLENRLRDMSITCRSLPHIGNLVVADGYRRKGIALKLMQEVLRQTRDWNIDAPLVLCAVEPCNVAARTLYDKMGFQFVIMEEKDMLAGPELAKDRIILSMQR